MKKKFFPVFCRTITGFLSGNPCVIRCHLKVIFPSDRELNSEQDGRIYKLGEVGKLFETDDLKMKTAKKPTKTKFFGFFFRFLKSPVSIIYDQPVLLPISPKYQNIDSRKF